MSKITKTSILNGIMDGNIILINETYFKYDKAKKKFYWTENSSSEYITKKHIEELIDLLLNWKDKYKTITLIDWNWYALIANNWGELKFYKEGPCII